jgi:hypothetical protein
MSDKLVFDLAQEIEGSPNVFVRKDWINILDNQNQNYNNNQSVLDTSQLSNSNKYMSYREAYLSIPFLISLGLVSGKSGTAVSTAVPLLDFSKAGDYAIGLKNWFGQIIHSFTLDYNGTTIIQQTPYINFWNSFKLMTSLSLNDVSTQGTTIGFYPDNPLSFSFVPVAKTNVSTGISSSGQGTVNNNNNVSAVAPITQLNCFEIANSGLYKRQQYINFDILSTTGTVGGYPTLQPVGTAISTTTYNSLIRNLDLLWKSNISKRSTGPYSAALVAGAATVTPAEGNGAYLCYTIVATVYLKHIHSFFNMCPLLKGVFMKMTMNLNNTSTSFSTKSTTAAGATSIVCNSLECSAVSNPLGGTNPLMIASGSTNTVVTVGSNVASGAAAELAAYPAGGQALFANITTPTAYVTTAGDVTLNYVSNVSVGAVCLNQTLNSVYGGNAFSGQSSKSIYLYIPAYTFNPIFEQAYLSSPVKQIKYTDVYQYQVINAASGSGGIFNNLLTNGIANIKSVLILPFYSASSGTAAAASTGAATAINNDNTGFLQGTPVWQSPFDPAGTGPTSPLCSLTNFNIQVSGQNAIYNIERYNFEQFNNQLYGQNAVNGGLTDGITSALIDRQAFDMNYCYYYVNVERMLPVEETVPKSIQILGQNSSARAIDLYCFIEYGNSINIDALTGARV